jgi:hypothetical protein
VGRRWLGEGRHLLTARVRPADDASHGLYQPQQRHAQPHRASGTTLVDSISRHATCHDSLDELVAPREHPSVSAGPNLLYTVPSTRRPTPHPRPPTPPRSRRSKRPPIGLTAPTLPSQRNHAADPTSPATQWAADVAGLRFCRSPRIPSPVNPTKHTTGRPLPEPRRPGPSRRARRSAQRPLAIRVKPRRRYRRRCRLEQPTFPPRDRDEEHGELPELPDPRLLRGVVATRAGSGLPRAEVLLFRAEAEDEEHRASVGRRAVHGRQRPRRQEVVTLQVGMPSSTPSSSRR